MVQSKANDTTAPMPGYRFAGEATFRHDFVGMQSEVRTSGLPAGSYVVTIVDHGDFNEVMTQQGVQVQRDTTRQPGRGTRTENRSTPQPRRQ